MEGQVEPGGFTFVRGAGAGGGGAGAARNRVREYARKSLGRSDAARGDARLAADMEAVLGGGAVYLKEFLCSVGDAGLMLALLRDLQAQGRGMVDWSQHLKFENPDFSATFLGIIERLSAHFSVEVFATRLNFYRDGSDWKPFHHDSHAYGAGGVKEDFTMGASFGAERALAFLHEPSGVGFEFPQANGDIFAFTSEVNKALKHGVPRGRRTDIGPRFSIIAWGRRHTINERNGGAEGEVTDNRMEGMAASGAGHHTPTPPTSAPTAASSVKDETVSIEEVTELVGRMLKEQEGRGKGKVPSGGTRREIGGAGPRGGPVRQLRREVGQEAFTALKIVSRRFQLGEIGAEGLYKQAQAALAGDQEKVEKWMQLAALLRDEPKRRALMAVHASSPRGQTLLPVAGARLVPPPARERTCSLMHNFFAW